ncbi:MAG TPA: hypothetical protein ENI53_02530 [Thermoplasmatales archaeon]|nr:hypothetical protein [Thermoplasmatales archaeon]
MKVMAIFILFSLIFAFYPKEEFKDGEWNKTYGEFEYNYAEDFVELKDGFLIVGSSCHNEFDGWIFKVDENGNEIWSKFYGGKKEDILQSVVEAKGGYIAVGYTLSYGRGDADFWVLKIDKDGNEIWNKTYGSKYVEYADYIVKGENSYIIAGQKIENDNYMTWVLKIDENGEEIWNKTYDIFGYVSFIKKIDNGYILGGETAFYGCLAKIDENGNIKWVRIYDGIDIIKDIEYAANGYILLGSSHIIKTDWKGNKEWIKKLNSRIDIGNSILKIEDNRYIIAGGTSCGAGGEDAFLIKIDDNGDEIWNKTFGGRMNDIAVKVIKRGEIYFVLGNTESFSSGWKAWLIKCYDYLPPKIEIVKPKEGYLYVFDREISYIGETFIIGKITTCAEANEKMDRVEIYIDKKEYALKPEKIFYNSPYVFTWDEKAFGIRYSYGLEVVAYYSNASANSVDRIYFKIINW